MSAVVKKGNTLRDDQYGSAGTQADGCEHII